MHAASKKRQSDGCLHMVELQQGASSPQKVKQATYLLIPYYLYTTSALALIRLTKTSHDAVTYPSLRGKMGACGECCRYTIAKVDLSLLLTILRVVSNSEATNGVGVRLKRGGSELGGGFAHSGGDLLPACFWPTHRRRLCSATSSKLLWTDQ